MIHLFLKDMKDIREDFSHLSAADQKLIEIRFKAEVETKHRKQLECCALLVENKRLKDNNVNYIYLSSSFFFSSELILFHMK